MKESARYVKIVEWSEEDQCYVGSSPGVLYGGCFESNEERRRLASGSSLLLCGADGHDRTRGNRKAASYEIPCDSP